MMTVREMLGEEKVPRAKFAAGDKVRIHGEWNGVVTRVLAYDEYLEQYKYKVAREDGAPAKIWNERSLEAR